MGVSKKMPARENGGNVTRNSARQGRVALYSALTLLALSLALRLIGLTHRSLWLDEITSLSVAQHSLFDIALGRAFNNHTPPLYYLILHCWFGVFSPDAFSLRLLSLVFDIANIALMFVIFRRQFGTNIGSFAAFLYCISPYAIYFAQEGRMYSMLVTLTLLTYLIAQRALEKQAKTLVALFITATLGMYTHYYYAFFLFAVFLWLAIAWRKDIPKLLKLGITALAVSLAFLPWVFVVVRLLAGEGQVFRRFVWLVVPYTLLRFLAGYGVMPISYGCKDQISRTILTHLKELSLYAIVSPVLVFLALRQLWRSYRPQALSLSLPLLIPLFVSLFFSLFTPILSERYLIVSFPFFIALLALLADQQDRELTQRLSCLMAALVFLLGTCAHHLNPAFGNTAWQQAAAAIAESPEICRIAFVSPEYERQTLSYYLGPEWALSAPGRIENSFTDKPDESRTNCSGFWLVERGTERSLLQTYLASGMKRHSSIFFPFENGLRVTALIPKTEGPVEKCEFVAKGDDSPQAAIGDIDRLPGRIGPPQKEEGIFRQSPEAK